MDVKELGMQLLDLAMWVCFWYFVLKVFNLLVMVLNVKRETDAIKEQMEEHLETTLHTVKEEVHGEVHYWFDHDNDQFLAQGKDISEVKEHLKQRFKDHIFIVKDRYVYAGPEYEEQDVGNSDAVTAYVAMYLLKRAGLKPIDE